jgi:putative transposase
VTWAVREKSYSQRRACGLVGLHPKTYRYASKRSGDEELRKRLRELASQRQRFGYRLLGLMLERQGIKLNAKKLYRFYKEERLTVRKRGGRKLVDDFTRECLGLVVDTSLTGLRVARELDRIAELRGYPCMNGTRPVRAALRR